MRKTVLAAAAAVTLALSLSACSSPAADTAMSEKPTAQSSSMTTEKSGEFMGLNEKAVAGTVTIADGELMLSGFSSDEGPDLHLYLTDGTDEAAVAAGEMVDAVSFDTASQTFVLKGVDVGDYTYVVVHCDKAKAVFGAAKLS